MPRDLPPAGQPALAARLALWAATDPDSIALRFLPDGEGHGTSLSYAEFDRRVSSLAAFLAWTIPRGERALLAYPAGLDFPTVFLAALRAGVVVVPVAVPSRSGERAALADAARLTGARHFLTTSAALSRLPPVPGIWTPTDEMCAGQAPAAPLPEPALEATAYLQLTSGTTGTPRAVAVSHRALGEQLAIYTARGGDEAHALTFVGWLPHTHDFGLVGFLLAAIWLGRPLVFMPPRSFLRRPLRWLEAISRHRGSFTGAPPFAYDLCAAADPQTRPTLDLSCLRIAALGGDYIAPALLERFSGAFAASGFDDAAWLPAYGLAEAVLSVTARRGLVVTRFDESALSERQARSVAAGGIALVSCGQPGEGQRLSIVDPATGGRLGSGRVGGIRVSGASLATEAGNEPLCDVDGWMPTGDLGFLHEGDLYVVGRNSDRIVLRGKTLFPEAIEATAVSAHPALRGAGTALIDGPGGPHLLQEMRRSSGQEAERICSAIHATLSRDHGIALAGLTLLPPHALPRSAAGKIARARARRMWHAGRLRRLPAGSASDSGLAASTPQAEPSTAEAALLSLARSLLPAGQIGVDTDLLAAGLDSLAAETLLARAEEVTGQTADLAMLLAAPTVAALARGVAEPPPGLPDSAPPPAVQGFNETQAGIALAEALEPAGTAGLFTNLMVLDLPPRTSFATVECLLGGLMAAHEALRQMRRDQGLTVADLPLPLERTRLPRGTSFADHLADLRGMPFDGLLWRARFFGGGRRPRLVFAASHLIADGRSFAQIAEALAAGLTGAPIRPPNAPQPVRSARHAAPAPANWRSPSSPAWGPVSLAARTHAFRLPATLRAELDTAARARGATLFNVLSAMSLATLYRFSGQERISLGFDMAGRDGAGRAEGIGCANRLAAMTLSIGSETTLEALIDRVRIAMPDALRFTPLADPGGGQPFAVHALINYQRLPVPPAGLTARFDLEAASLRFSPFGLVIDIRDLGGGGPLWIGLTCNSALYPGDWSRSFATVFRRIGQAIRRCPATPCVRLKLVPGPLRPAVLGRPAPAYAPLIPAILALAASGPLLPAVAFRGGSWSRGKLCRRAGGIASGLGSHGRGRVGLLLPRGPDFVAALLAVLAAGGTVVAMDTELPDARLFANAHAGGLDALLTDHDGRARNLRLAPQAFAIEDMPGEADLHALAPRADDPAYLTFTSGTTGAPKAVLVHHGGMVNHLAAKIADLEIGPDDRIAQTAPVSFDIYLWQCLAPLLAGATSRIFEASHPLALLRQADAAGVSHLQLVPSALEEALAAPAGDLPSFRHLRWIILTGEALPADLCRRWISHYPHAPVMNAYGPAECADDVAHHAVHWPPRPEEVRVPIGRPIAGVRFFLIDGAGNSVPPGAPGELVVGGTPVGLGYPGADNASAQAFRDDPSLPGGRVYHTGDLCLLRPDGALDLLGRVDRQIKLGGVRIEPAAVEQVLRGTPGIGAARVGLRRIPEGDDRLVAWLVARPGTHPPEPGRIRARALGLLPRAMVPVTFVYVDAFPRQPNGKINDADLPDPPPPPPDAHAPPQGRAEEQLAAIWASILGGRAPGRDEDFFDLGGTSLLATRVMLELEEAMGMELPVTQIFKTPTIAGLAEALDRFRAARMGEAP